MSPRVFSRERMSREALLEQLKRMVKDSRRLAEARFQADAQILRIGTLNHFALQAAQHSHPERVLELGADLLLKLFPYVQVLGGLLTTDEVQGEPTLGAKALGPWPNETLGIRICVAKGSPGAEGNSGVWLAGDPQVRLGAGSAQLLRGQGGPRLMDGTQWPQALDPLRSSLREAFDGALESSAFQHEESRALLVTLCRGRGEVAGLLLAFCGDQRELSAHEHLPTDVERPFLDLMNAHLGQALDNALLQREVSRMASSLERRVEQRTEELKTANKALDQNLSELERTQAELLHAGRMAAVGTLVAGLSHELAKPVMVIEGYAKALLERLAPQGQDQKALEAIERQAMRCGNLIEGLLVFSRKPATRRESCSVDELLDQVVALADSTAATLGVRLEVDNTLVAIPEILGVRADLESAFLNLINNALDVSKPGQCVRLELGLRARHHVPGICLRVKDLGEGIPESIREQIFDPFFTTKPMGSGVGLGLALSDRIVASHGGKLSLESSGSAGSVFTIWLPVN